MTWIPVCIKFHENPVETMISFLNAIQNSLDFDFTLLPNYIMHCDDLNPMTILKSFTREKQLLKIKENNYDIIVIGGGATGAGCCYQATLQGYKVCLLEANDFASGTSSKSTKLLHGGIRYLEKAFWNFDKRQFDLVKEALHERKHFFTIAPQLCYKIPVLIPSTSYMMLPYHYAGAKVYDWISGKESLNPSYFLSKKLMLSLFPQINPNRFVGGVIFYDGMQDDARMNMMLALTSAFHGATVLNYAPVTSLLKDNNRITGVVMKDKLDNSEHHINAKIVINATGPFTDQLMRLDNPGHSDIVVPSRGTHLTLPSYICPKEMGIVDPSSDGRVTYLLPWLNESIAGTTDEKCDVEEHSKPTQQEIDWILKELKTYLHPDLPLDKDDIKSTWSGIRPLVRDPDAKDTSALVRSHKVITSNSGLISIVGGKWTSYRAMANDTIEAAQSNGLGKTITSIKSMMLGAENWHSFYFADLMKKYKINEDVLLIHADCKTFIP